MNQNNYGVPPCDSDHPSLDANATRTALGAVSDRRDEQDSSGYGRSLSYLYDRINYERMPAGTARYPFRLDRMRQLLMRLGLGANLHHPADAESSCGVGRPVPLVHIAGTKGKGSTASMVAAALSAAGMCTGLYTSPHLHRLEERFRVDGRPCDPRDIVTMVDQLGRLLETSDRQNEAFRNCSFFELTTAMAMMHFDRRGCDAIVLEVGLGGRLDSTNVCAAAVTAITPIGLDHQHVLGNTLEQIATEKAGIIKSSAPVVCGISAKDPSMKDVIEVITRRAEQYSAPMYLLDRDFRFDHFDRSGWGARVEYQGIHSPMTQRLTVDLAVEGRHQSANAATAIAIIDVLRAQGAVVSADAAAGGIAALTCPARVERFDLRDDVVALVDAAHNSDSVEALCRCIELRRGEREVTVVFGTSRDKSAGEMLKRLSQCADRLVLTQFAGNPRFLPADDLLPLVPEHLTSKTIVAKDPIEACGKGLKSASPAGMVVVCGSFFVAAETRMWIAEKSTKTN